MTLVPKHIVPWRLWLTALACLIAAWPIAARAHTRSESHSSWTIDGPVVHLAFSVADREAARITGDRPSNAALLAYLTPRVGVDTGGTACKLTAPPHPVVAAPGYRRIEFEFACAAATGIHLHDTAFFELVPTHVNFAQVQSQSGDFVEQLVSAGDPPLSIGDRGDGLESAGFFRFVGMGIMHIFTGVDHMSFLVGLVLISRRLRDLVFVVTGFTLGHSLTLALAVTGIIRPHAEFIDALVALTIALIGAENISVASGRPGMVALGTGACLAVMAGLRLAGIGLLPPLLLIGAGLFAVSYLLGAGHLRDAGRIRLVVTLVFGLIHGFGFAADLLQSRLPPAKLAEILVGFNFGVEAGQLTIVLLLTGATAVLVRRHWALPRPIVTDVMASVLVALGTFWFVGRSFA